MNKELQALEDITLYLNANEPKGLYCKNIETIKNALIEIDEIFENHNIKSFTELNERLCYYNEIKFDDDIKQMKLKALDIIKAKRANVCLLLRCATVERYNKGICYEAKHLTQEEFNLLKEVLL